MVSSTGRGRGCRGARGRRLGSPLTLVCRPAQVKTCSVGAKGRVVRGAPCRSPRLAWLGGRVGMDRPPIASMSQGGLDLSFPLSAEQTGGIVSVIQIQV